MSQIVVVTGGAGGIGQAVADRLTREKHTVVILDINHESGNEVAAAFHKRGTPLSFLRADVARETEVQAAFDKIKADHGRIDVLGERRRREHA